MKESDNDQPEFGRLLSKPDMSVEKVSLHVMVILISLPLVFISITFKDLSDQFTNVLIFCGMTFIFACYLSSFFLTLEIYENGFVNKHYQTWTWKKERVQSYEVIDATWDRLFIFPKNYVTLVGVTDAGEKKKVIRRGKYPKTQNVFDEIHDAIIKSDADKQDSNHFPKDEFDIIMKFSNKHVVLMLTIPICLWLGNICMVYFFYSTFSVLSLSTFVILISLLSWSLGSIVYLEFPWDRVRTYMISEKRVRCIANSVRKIVTDVEFDTITKIEMKTSIFSQCLKVYFQEDDMECIVALYVSIIDNNIDDIEKFFKEIMNRIPAEIQRTPS